MTIAKGAVIPKPLNMRWEIQELEWDEPRDDEVGVRYRPAFRRIQGKAQIPYFAELEINSQT